MRFIRNPLPYSLLDIGVRRSWKQAKRIAQTFYTGRPTTSEENVNVYVQQRPGLLEQHLHRKIWSTYQRYKTSQN